MKIIEPRCRYENDELWQWRIILDRPFEDSMTSSECRPNNQVKLQANSLHPQGKSQAKYAHLFHEMSWAKLNFINIPSRKHILIWV